MMVRLRDNVFDFPAGPMFNDYSRALADNLRVVESIGLQEVLWLTIGVNENP